MVYGWGVDRCVVPSAYLDGIAGYVFHSGRPGLGVQAQWDLY